MARGRMEASAEVWRERVQRWKASGLTAKEFSEREGIARPGALSWWQYHLKRSGVGEKGEGQPALKLVKLEPVRRKQRRSQPSSSLTVQCGAHRVVVSHDFDEALLRRVLCVLEAAR